MRIEIVGNRVRIVSDHGVIVQENPVIKSTDQFGETTECSAVRIRPEFTRGEDR